MTEPNGYPKGYDSELSHSMENQPRHFDQVSSTGSSREPFTARAIANEKLLALVSQMVEREIVPRLMLAHKNLQVVQGTGDTMETASTSGLVRVRTAAITELVDRFAQMSIAEDIQPLEFFIKDLTARGFNDEAIYLDLLAPTARRLGDMWMEDSCSFTDVTMGLSKLQLILGFMSDRALMEVTPAANGPKALFVTPEGAQHHLGIRMVDDLFIRSGWVSRCQPEITADALKLLVASEHFDLFGIGVSCSEQVDSARSLIEIVRKTSHNGHVQVMLGGSLSLEMPELANELGADLTACDACEAVTIAQSNINIHKQRH